MKNEDHVCDSEEFLVLEPEERYSNGELMRPAVTLRRCSLISESIAKSEIGWAGFVCLGMLSLGAFVLAVAFAYWVAFAPPTPKDNTACPVCRMPMEQHYPSDRSDCMKEARNRKPELPAEAK